MPRASTGWRWKTARRAGATTASPTRACPPANSRRPWVAAWVCRLKSLSGEEAKAHFGWMAFFFGMDLAASSALTRERLDWQPTHPGLLADLDEAHYFAD